MRITFVVPRFLPEMGGVEKHVFCVARELVKHENSIRIITGTYELALKKEEQIDSIHVYRILLKSPSQHKSSTIISLLKAWCFFARNPRTLVDTDIIHLHDAQTFLWILPAILLLRKPLYMTFHGFEGYPIPNYARIIRKIAEKVVDGNICAGTFITKWYGTTPTYETIGGVQSPETTSETDVKNAALFVGRLSEDTGIHEFIEALRILREKHRIDLALHVCGDGPLWREIQAFAKHNQLKVVMHGFVKEPQDYLLKCQYAFVSGYLAILEAMSCKKAVFAIYSNPLKRDYLYSIPTADRLMFIAGSPEELAEKLCIAAENPEQVEAIVRRAYAFSKEQTWEKVARLYLKLYNSD